MAPMYSNMFDETKKKKIHLQMNQTKQNANNNPGYGMLSKIPI